jgi:hypothetical protein
MFGKYNGFVRKARVSAFMYFLVNIYIYSAPKSTDVTFQNLEGKF